jgi:hypothetical protein
MVLHAMQVLNSQLYVIYPAFWMQYTYNKYLYILYFTCFAKQEQTKALSDLLPRPCLNWLNKTFLLPFN